MRRYAAVPLLIACLLAVGAFVLWRRDKSLPKAAETARIDAAAAAASRPTPAISGDARDAKDASGDESQLDPVAMRRNPFGANPDPAEVIEPVLYGTVVGPDGRPQSAVVTLFELPEASVPGAGPPSEVDVVSTNEAGEFTVAAFRPGLHRLVAVSADGVSATANLSSASFAHDLVFRLPPPPAPVRSPADDLRPLAGRVVRSTTEAPLQKVRVVGRRTNATDGDDPATARFVAMTDEDGRFSVAVTAGRWKVRAEPHAEAMSAEVDAEPDGPPVTVFAERPWRISVQAARPDGRPVLRARLRTSFASPRGAAAGPERVARSSDGRFEIKGTIAARLAVEIEAPGSPPVVVGTFDMNPGEEREAPAVLIDDGLLLTGTVADVSGRPFPFAAVRAVRGFGAERRATTDAAGVFVLDRVARDVAALVVEHEDAVEPRRFPAPPPQGAAVVELGALHLERGGAIRGVVRRKDGSPDAAAIVQAIEQAARPGGSRVKEAATDALGRYRISGLGAGPWRVRALKREGGFATDEADRGLVPPTVVTVVAEQSVTTDL